MKKLTKETISLPDTNPYPIVLNEISQLRKSQQPPINIKDVPLKLLPNEEMKFAVSGKKTDGLINELTTSAGVPAHLLSKNNPALVKTVLPVLKRMVEHVKGQTTDLPYEPYTFNAYDRYCSPSRFDKEVESLKKVFLCAGSSSDIASIGDYSRIMMNHKSILIVRGKNNRVYAYENINKKANHIPIVGASQSGRGNLRNINIQYEHIPGKSLPCGEKSGLIFVITHPEEAGYSDSEIESRLNDILSPALSEELNSFSLDKSASAIFQEVLVQANWKLALDTFGECYHFESVHKNNFGLTRTCNKQVFRKWDDRNGLPRNSCMTVGTLATLLMADGDIEESNWKFPTPVSIFIYTFFTCIIVFIIVGSLTYIYANHHI